jgi:hypothetical protein
MQLLLPRWASVNLATFGFSLVRLTLMDADVVAGQSSSCPGIHVKVTHTGLCALAYGTAAAFGLFVSIAAAPGIEEDQPVKPKRVLGATVTPVEGPTALVSAPAAERSRTLTRSPEVR